MQAIADIDYEHQRPGNDDAGDKKLYVVFRNHYVKDEFESQKQGRFVSKPTVFIKIFVPGDRSNVIDRPLRPDDEFRFPGQWQRFQKGQEQRAVGTPLEEWPAVTSGMVEELKYLGFQTVEQVAEANDSAAQKFMGIQDLKNKAKAYLAVAAGNTAPISELTQQLKDEQANSKILAETVRKLNEKVEQLLAAKK